MISTCRKNAEGLLLTKKEGNKTVTKQYNRKTGSSEIVSVEILDRKAQARKEMLEARKRRKKGKKK